MDEINAITSEQIASLRRNFHEKVTSQSPGFHPDDIERVNTDDLWLRRFLAHAGAESMSADKMLYDCCQWRKEFQTNELDANKIGMDLIDKGVLFIRNKDVFGKNLLVFKAKQHTKGTVEIEKMQKYVVYWFERIERESNSDQISIIFDMKDTGWNNMDMDFVRYLITLLKTYYPYFVNYLVIFEMPWLLNAAWKIIKGWLPPKFVDRVKFLDKKTLKDFIDVDNQLQDWGGNDKYVFKFEPEISKKRQIERKSNNNNSNGNAVSEAKSRNKVQLTGNEQVRHQFEYSESTSGSPSPIPSSTLGLGAPSGVQNDNCLADVEGRIIFRPSENEEYSAQLMVKNKSPNGEAVIIKIKTTSPEKYRVKPIIAVLTGNATATITVTTHQGVSATTLTRDRFQVQVAIVPPKMMPRPLSEGSDSSSDASQQNVGDLGNNFKEIVRTGTLLETYRVAVAVEARAGDTGTGSGSSIDLNDDRLRRGLEDLEKKITESVSNKVTKNIADSQRIFLIAFGIITILLTIIVVYLYKLSKDSSIDYAKVCQGNLESGQWTGTPQDSTCTG